MSAAAPRATPPTAGVNGGDSCAQCRPVIEVEALDYSVTVMHASCTRLDLSFDNGLVCGLQEKGGTCPGR